MYIPVNKRPKTKKRPQTQTQTFRGGTMLKSVSKDKKRKPQTLRELFWDLFWYEPSGRLRRPGGMYKRKRGLNKPREGQIGRARPTSIKVARGVQAPQLYKAPRIREATSPPFTNLLQQRCSSSANRNHKIEDATAGAAPDGPRKVLETMRGIQLQTLNQKHGAKVSCGSALGSQKRPRHGNKQLALATGVKL